MELRPGPEATLEGCHAAALAQTLRVAKVSHTSLNQKNITKSILNLQLREHGTFGVHGVPVPQHVTALEFGAGPDLILATCHALAAIQRRQAVKVRSVLQQR